MDSVRLCVMSFFMAVFVLSSPVTASHVMDKFEDGDVAEWSVSSGSSSNWNAVTHDLHGSYAGELTSSGTYQEMHLSVSGKDVNNTTWVAEYSSFGSGEVNYWIPNSGSNEFQFKVTTSGVAKAYYWDGSWSTWKSVAQLQTGIQYKWVVKYNSGKNYATYIYYKKNGTLVNSVSSKMSGARETINGFWIAEGGGTSYIDYIARGTTTVPSTKVNVSGYVKTGETPIENATVTTNTSKTTTTNSTGYYKFKLQKGSSYNLTASKQGYYNNTTTINVSGSMSNVNITLEAVPASGYVYSGSGNAISSATVELEYEVNNTVIASTTTTSTGFYEIKKTPSEETEIVVTKSGYSSTIERSLDSDSSQVTLTKTDSKTGITINANNTDIESVTVSEFSGSAIVVNGKNAFLKRVTTKRVDYGITVLKGAGTHSLKSLHLEQAALLGINNTDSETVTVESGLGKFIDHFGKVSR